MSVFLSLILILTAVGLIVVIFRDHRLGRCELVSVRNVFLAGFILFQLSSGVMTLLTEAYGQLHLEHPVATGTEYVAMVVVFLALMLWGYQKGWIANKLAAKLPATRVLPGDMMLLAMAALITLFAVVMRFSLQVPVIGPAAVQIATGFAAVACGLVGWVWAKRMLNPVVLFYALAIFIANSAIVMYGSFGRRGLVAVGAGLIWGMYYSHWRFLPPRVFAKRLAVVAAGPIIVVALFTSVRESATVHRTTGEHFQAVMAGGQLTDGLLDLASGQGCATASMWLLETHPENFEYRHLFSIWYFLVYPVPRMFWDEKPQPISKEIPTLAMMQGVPRDVLTIGPGVVGTAGAEGGWYALVIYAIVIGLFLRFFDQAINLHPYSPFFVVPIGSSLGQILGMPRGEVSAFAFLGCLATFGALVLMVVAGKLIERFVPTVAEDQIEIDEEIDGVDDWDPQMDWSSPADSVGTEPI